MRFWVLAAVACVVVSLNMSSAARAVSQSAVIQALRVGTPDGASEEYITIRNTSETAIDISGWKLIYTSASGLTERNLKIFSTTATNHVLLPAATSETLLSNELASRTEADISAMRFSSGLSATGGSISLLDNTGLLVDRVGWGTATVFETRAALAPGVQVLARSGIDTDDNSVDFSLVAGDLEAQLIYGSLVDVTDICSNIPGIQLEIPIDMSLQASNMCVNLDLCTNIDGFQIDISAYDVEGTNCYAPFEPSDLRLTEVLPNPEGIDDNGEFIEIYNATDKPVELDNYHLSMGGRTYNFPAGSRIDAGAYLTFTDTQLGVVLPNTTGKDIYLLGRDNSQTSRIPAYTGASDDNSWAHIDDIWQYTNRPTPGEANLASLILGSGAIQVSQADCGVGKYRNPATNRCKTIEAPTYEPCAAGEIRNSATNRCRKIATATSGIAPCQPGQYRNPATNRCKATSSASTSLAACKPGQERNPETNRCRKTAVLAADMKSFPVEPVKNEPTVFVAWWALGGVVAAGLAYGVWEFRHEIKSGIKRVFVKDKA